MDYIRSKRSSGHHPLDDERPAKRISTPAGQRLSVILDASKRNKSPSPAKISVTTTSTYCNDPTHQHIEPVQHNGPKTPRKTGMVSLLTGGRLGDTPRESLEEQTPNASNLSVSVWSDRDTEGEKFGELRQRSRRGITAWGWKRLAIIGAILIVCIIALSVGLAVGLKKKDSNSTQTAPESASGTIGPNSPQSSPAVPSVPIPSDFPLGSYSFLTFLDTVTTECTSNPGTWTCAPKTDYYTDPQKALTMLNWQISGSAGSYKISSKGQDPTFDTMFQNEKLELLDAGKDQERYRFQISRSKSVNMTGSIGDARGDFNCDFGTTNIQGFLYTKMQRTYPGDTISVTGAGENIWPYAVRVEQTVAGGQGIPSCSTSSGEELKNGTKAQDASTLCSCLYKNWTPGKL